MTRELDSKTMAILAAGICVVMVLTFMAGIVTGIALWTPTRRELALLKGGAESPPVVQTATAAPHPATATVAATPPPPTVVVPVTPAPQVGAQPAPTVAPAAAPAPAPTPAPAAAAEPVAGQPAAPTVAADVFSLQLGSFLDAKNAKQLQSELKDRGYASSIFTALDGEQREWHVVRIGGFPTLTSASHAASNFTSKERIPAFVRRSDRL